MSTALFRHNFRALPRFVRSFSRMSVVGRVVKEPELITYSTGELIKFSVCVRSRRENTPPTYWDIASFSKSEARRDFILNIPAGAQVFVEADASKTVTESPDGVKTRRLSLVERNIEVLARTPWGSSKKSDKLDNEDGAMHASHPGDPDYDPVNSN